MCERVVKNEPKMPLHVPDHFKTQSMCEKAVENDPEALEFVSAHFKTQEICNETIEVCPWSLEYIPDWLVTREAVDMWCDGVDYYDEDNFFKWYEGYKKRKAQKASIKEELMQR